MARIVLNPAIQVISGNEDECHPVRGGCRLLGMAALDGDAIRRKPGGFLDCVRVYNVYIR